MYAACCHQLGFWRQGSVFSGATRSWASVKHVLAASNLNLTYCKRLAHSSFEGLILQGRLELLTHESASSATAVMSYNMLFVLVMPLGAAVCHHRGPLWQLHCGPKHTHNHTAGEAAET